MNTLLSQIAHTVGIEPTFIRMPTAKRHDDWQQTAFEWRVTLRYQGREMTVPYFCGSAHVTKPKNVRMLATPIAPDAPSVLSSLLLDASAADTTFADWCEEYGRDTDSRKALDTFLECQQIGVNLKRLLGADYAKFVEAENDV